MLPMQPVILDASGTARFRANAVVVWLLNVRGGPVTISHLRKAYPAEAVEEFLRLQDNKAVQFFIANRNVTLNDLVVQADIPDDHLEQFAQLIGYSVAGFHELPYVTDEAALAASKAARALLPGAGGCRDHGCSIHCHEPRLTT